MIFPAYQSASINSDPYTGLCLGNPLHYQLHIYRMTRHIYLNLPQTMLARGEGRRIDKLLVHYLGLRGNYKQYVYLFPYIITLQPLINQPLVEHQHISVPPLSAEK